jgi:hypothetical protein
LTLEELETATLTYPQHPPQSVGLKEAAFRLHALPRSSQQLLRKPKNAVPNKKDCQIGNLNPLV